MLIRDKIDSSLNSNGIRFVLHRFELNKHFISEKQHKFRWQFWTQCTDNSFFHGKMQKFQENFAFLSWWFAMQSLLFNRISIETMIPNDRTFPESSCWHVSWIISSGIISTALNRVLVQHKNLPEFLDDDLVPKGNSKHLAKHIQWFVTVVIRCGLHCNWHRIVEPMRTSHGHRWKCSLVLCTPFYGKIFATAFQAAEWRIFIVISKLPDNWN